jgi:hypothetical protein
LIDRLISDDDGGNDDDFDEGDGGDVENLTLTDDEFAMVNKLSAGSLGLQVLLHNSPHHEHSAYFLV